MTNFWHILLRCYLSLVWASTLFDTPKITAVFLFNQTHFYFYFRFVRVIFFGISCSSEMARNWNFRGSLHANFFCSIQRYLDSFFLDIELNIIGALSGALSINMHRTHTVHFLAGILEPSALILCVPYMKSIY